MSKNKLIFDIAIFLSLVLIIGFAAVQAKDLNFLDSKINECADGPNCGTPKETIPVSGSGSDDYMFITNMENDCAEAAKKQPISDGKINAVKNEALNACKDNMFSLQNFACSSPCKPISYPDPACSITSGPSLSDIRECGEAFGGRKKCCATLSAEATGALTRYCGEITYTI